MKKTYQSYIHCEGCKNTVSAVLDNHDGVVGWEVDLSHSQKLITIDFGQDAEKEIVDALSNLGYDLKTTE